MEVGSGSEGGSEGGGEGEVRVCVDRERARAVGNGGGRRRAERWEGSGDASWPRGAGRRGMASTGWARGPWDRAGWREGVEDMDGVEGSELVSE